MIDPTIPPAVAGEAGWDYHQSVEVDLDGDGRPERVVLTARVALVRGRPAWDDGQPWQVYFEAPDSGRTYLYAQRLQLGTLEMRVGRTDAARPASIVLLEQLPDRLSLHEAFYLGPDSVSVATRFQRDLDASQGSDTEPMEAMSGMPGADAGSAATPLDLAGLGAMLDVPVQGVTRSQLRDSYSEPRGDHAHEAMDILAERGTPVVSATGGRVLKLFDSKPGGLMVYAADPSGRFILLYGHLDRYADGLADGAGLYRGQVIGYVGTTGNAPPGTPHLHFGIMRGDPDVSWARGTPVNPYPLLIAATLPSDSSRN
ncbi:MAG TPA: M23 family metallopeptidase [Longimicrobiales bacterium]|nr:M23 family metallopeptidase [Longimicrobiales bacterium]